MKFHLKRQKKFFLLSLNDEKIFENFFKKQKILIWYTGLGMSIIEKKR